MLHVCRRLRPPRVCDWQVRPLLAYKYLHFQFWPRYTHSSTRTACSLPAPELDYYFHAPSMACKLCHLTFDVCPCYPDLCPLQLCRPTRRSPTAPSLIVFSPRVTSTPSPPSAYGRVSKKSWAMISQRRRYGTGASERIYYHSNILPGGRDGPHHEALRQVQQRRAWRT